MEKESEGGEPGESWSQLPREEKVAEEENRHGLKHCSTLRKDGALELGGLVIFWSRSSLWKYSWMAKAAHHPSCLPLPLGPLIRSSIPSPPSGLRALLFQGGGGQVKAVFLKKYHCLMELY